MKALLKICACVLLLWPAACLATPAQDAANAAADSLESAAGQYEQEIVAQETAAENANAAKEAKEAFVTAWYYHVF